MSENKYVYHGSHIPDLKVIKPHKSTHQQNWVYATSSKAVATIYIITWVVMTKITILFS